jgi:hypothetical protein
MAKEQSPANENRATGLPGRGGLFVRPGTSSGFSGSRFLFDTPGEKVKIRAASPGRGFANAFAACRGYASVENLTSPTAGRTPTLRKNSKKLVIYQPFSESGCVKRQPPTVVQTILIRD